jgi:hypothetical protein
MTMSGRFALLALVLSLITTEAAAGTKVQLNIIPAPPDCFIIAGGCLNVGLSCGSDNSECALGTMSPKSKVTIPDTLKVTGTIQGVTDGAGALMTTGPGEGDSNNPVLRIAISACPVDTGAPPICDDVTSVYVKVVLKAGKGKVKVDLGPVFSIPSGSPFAVLGVALLESPGAGNCLGTNSATDIAARLNDTTCDSVIVRGVGGFVRK